MPLICRKSRSKRPFTHRLCCSRHRACTTTGPVKPVQILDAGLSDRCSKTSSCDLNIPQLHDNRLKGTVGPIPRTTHCHASLARNKSCFNAFSPKTSRNSPMDPRDAVSNAARSPSPVPNTIWVGHPPRRHQNS